MAKRGFCVTVYEKESAAGGQVSLAAKPPHKEKLNWCIEDLLYACEVLGVEIKYSTEVTKKFIEDEKPYAVICATGAFAFKPKSIKGTDKEFVYTTTDILDGRVAIEGKNVVVIGSGMTGLETAEFLTTMNNKVGVVEMADDLAPGVWMQHPNDVIPRLEEKETEFYLSKRLASIVDDGIIVEDIKTKSSLKIPADAVVLALGSKPENSLYEQLKYMPNVYAIGDASKIGRIADATMSAFKCVKSIN